MKRYNFERTKKFSHDILISFLVDDFVVNKDTTEEEAFADLFSGMGVESRARFKEIYGDNLNREDLRESLKIEIKRLLKEEDEIETDLIDYITTKIIQDREHEGEYISQEKLKEYSEDLKLFNFYNFSNYKILYAYLFAAKNKTDFENITEALSLKNDFTHYDVLFMKTLSDEKITKNFNPQDPEKLLSIYMSSDFGIKSLTQYLSILNNSDDKYGDLRFVEFQTNFLSENTPRLTRCNVYEDIVDKKLPEKFKELLAGIGSQLRSKTKELLSQLKKNKKTIGETTNTLLALNKMNDIYKLTVRSMLKYNNELLLKADKDLINSIIEYHNKHMTENNKILNNAISDKKMEMKQKKSEELKKLAE